MNYVQIRHHFDAYQEASRILASNRTTVAERKSAIDVRDEFMASAANYVRYLLHTIEDEVRATDGEECADPESCGHTKAGWQCSRCRLRQLA